MNRRMNEAWYSLSPDLSGPWHFPFIHEPKSTKVDSDQLPFTLPRHAFMRLNADPNIHSLVLPNCAILPDVLSLAYIQLSHGMLCTHKAAMILDGMRLSFPVEIYSWKTGRNDEPTLFYYHYCKSSFLHLNSIDSQFTAFNTFFRTRRSLTTVEAETGRFEMGEILLAEHLVFNDCSFDLYSFGIQNAPLIASQRLVAAFNKAGITGVVPVETGIVECPS